MTAPASRRGFLAAFAAFSGAAVTTTAAVALTPSTTTPEADAELIAAGERLVAVQAVETAAREAEGEADRLYREAMGWCPDPLLLDERYGSVEELTAARQLSRQALRPDYDYAEEFGWDGLSLRWTGEMVRAVLHHLPAIYGRAGPTPKLIRHYRGILALAETRDAADEECRRRYDLARLARERAAARKALDHAEHEVERLPATTLAGLAVKVRHWQAWEAYNRERASWKMKQPAAIESMMVAVQAVVIGPGAGL